MKENDYRRVTFDITLATARTLARLNPALTFIYVSGEGTDSERGRGMWARVKGETENALLRLLFKAVMFESQSLRTNVTFMFTRYSVIFPFSTFAFCSWIQALLMFFRVFSARALPTRRASSKLFVDEAVIS